MGILNTLFGNKKEALKKFQSREAIIIDVRTPQEFKQGAIKDSKNIPLQTISLKIDAIKKLNKPIITCCASGMRSSKAATILRNNGIESMNGGGWVSLKRTIEF